MREVYLWTEELLQRIFDIEVHVGLRWLGSVRDEFRYMWE